MQIHRSNIFRAILIPFVLSGSRAAADAVNALVYVNENGAAYYFSKDPTDCNNKRLNNPTLGKAGGYRCDLSDVPAGGVSTIKFGGAKALPLAYGVNVGDYLLTESGSSDPSDLISFPIAGTIKTNKDHDVATSILFYSLADDTDTDGTTDTKDLSIFKKAGAISVQEVNLTGEVDTFTDGTQILFPSLLGSVGYAFTATGEDAVGAVPKYSNTIIRYVFVSDSPEPRLSLTLGVSLVAFACLKAAIETFFSRLSVNPPTLVSARRITEQRLRVLSLRWRIPHCIEIPDELGRGGAGWPGSRCRGDR